MSGKNQKACCETDDRKYLYFKFDKDQNSPVALPKPAQSGRWYISTGWYISADRFVIFDDDEAIVTESIEYGFTSCPNDALVMKIWNVILVQRQILGKGWERFLGKVGTCDRVHDPTIFFNKNKNECNLQKVHRQLIHQMKEQLTKFRPDSLTNDGSNANEYYPMIPNSIEKLVQKNCLAQLRVDVLDVHQPVVLQKDMNLDVQTFVTTSDPWKNQRIW